jgi:hypothetical protein
VVNSNKTLKASRLNVGLDETNSLRVLKPADILNKGDLNIGVQKGEAAHKGWEARLTVPHPRTNLSADS